VSAPSRRTECAEPGVCAFFFFFFLPPFPFSLVEVPGFHRREVRRRLRNSRHRARNVQVLPFLFPSFLVAGVVIRERKGDAGAACGWTILADVRVSPFLFFFFLSGVARAVLAVWFLFFFCENPPLFPFFFSSFPPFAKRAPGDRYRNRITVQ